jgi:hypothetical protein
MRRILLIPLALAAFVLAPAAAANAANTVSGACSIAGGAQFTPTGLTNTPTSMGYTFTGTGSCSGTLNGAPIVSAPVSTSVTGTGTLSCAASVSTTGHGTLTFPNQGVTIGFNISLAGAGSEVAFELSGDGGGAGAGHASFATNAARVAECQNASGLNDLGFAVEATAANLTS